MQPALTQPPPPPPDSAARPLRDCLGRFGTGVSTVTYAEDTGARGITISSFTSVSLDPSLVLISVGRRARACAGLRDAPFVVNVLSADQAPLALHFAGRPQSGLPVPWVDQDGVPRLDGTVAWLRCRPWRAYDGGDHVLFLGEVQDFAFTSGDPLLFQDGSFRRPGPRIAVPPALESA
ncbi:flavin reductase family protein [Streptomyces sp. A012304]|uniref:flavin reductase family protein n=1 Tax=Streptomyces sp. A012304 TaxID=375446 RepID=UPI00222E2601|nr:flavin reductase family protein [Streptomyces sp. A012304]GKQ35328.1 flavin oxidoreductase [Streptomyces sp. A012304]